MAMPPSRAASRMVFPSWVMISFPSMVNRIMSIPYRSTQRNHADPVAAETTCSLAERHRGSVACFHFLEGPLPLFRVEHRQVRLLETADDAELLLFVVDPEGGKKGSEFFIDRGFHLAGGQEEVDLFRRPLAVARCPDQHIRTGDAVAASEHPRLRGGKGFSVGINRFPFRKLDAVCLFQEGIIHLLTDGRDEDIRFNDKFRTRHGDGSSSAALIRFAELHADTL